MNYSETQQKQILRAMEDELLALVAVDLRDHSFEVIYTDGAYKEYTDRYRGKDFFSRWNLVGLGMVAPEDRKRMREEISPEFLSEKLESGSAWMTVCRMTATGSPRFCRIKAVRDVLEEDTLILSFRDIHDEMLQRQALEKQMEDLRIAACVKQIHPHFLYNALSSIREIVLEDPQYGADLLYDFSTHLRAGIRAMGKTGMIPFEEELEHIRAYLNIEKMRLGERLDIEYKIGAEDFEIVPLSVEPLVENAVKHGIFPKGKGTVCLETKRTGKGILIRVEDDGAGFDRDRVLEKIGNGEKDAQGLLNVRDRLVSMMHADFVIDSVPGQGTMVTILLPDAKKNVSSALVRR